MGEFIFGKSKVMHDIQQDLSKIAKSDLPVFIEGETGTGKNILAKKIHELSDRNNNPFIRLDVSSLPEKLVESSLFGHEKGAFTDAKEKKTGAIEEADKGTLFLDEVENFDCLIQLKLLSVLNEKQFRRIGGRQDINVDFRIISASNDNILEKVQKGCFRMDLFYRLKAEEIHLPPLRERPEDIYSLAEYFLECLNRSEKWDKIFSAEIKPYLESFPWPGNARELEYEIKRASLRASGREICRECFSLNFEKAHFLLENNDKFKSTSIEHHEKELIKQVLQRENFNKTRAAKKLGIGVNTLYRKSKQYGL